MWFALNTHTWGFAISVARELGETMTDEELQEMVDRADSNGDGAVTMDDFYNIMTKKTFA